MVRHDKWQPRLRIRKETTSQPDRNFEKYIQAIEKHAHWTTSSVVYFFGEHNHGFQKARALRPQTAKEKIIRECGGTLPPGLNLLYIKR
jgi:hypothetical protein